MKGISQMGLHGMGWVAQPWFSVSWRGREPSSYSTYKAGCLRSSSLVLKTWRISRESLASRPHWKTEGAGVWRQWRTERVSIHGGSIDRHTHTFSQELRDRQSCFFLGHLLGDAAYSEGGSLPPLSHSSLETYHRHTQRYAFHVIPDPTELTVKIKPHHL